MTDGDQLAPGTDVSGYRVVRLLGSGGMGEVYLVEHPRLPRRDALKLLSRRVSGDAEFRERLVGESDILARLHHRNIIRVYDRGEFDGRLWITMEYIDGVDVGALLTNGPLRVDQVIAVADGVAAALDYAWTRHRVVHRDVKPANILVSLGADGAVEEVSLADFGIARAAGVAADGAGAPGTVGSGSSGSGSGVTAGTFAYLAPEVFDDHVTDVRTDEYALACTVFEMLTGRRLFTSRTAAALMRDHLLAPPPSVSAVSRLVPPTVDVVLARALAKRPEQRYPTCAQFSADLRAALRTGPAPTLPAPPHPAHPTAGAGVAPAWPSSAQVPQVQPFAARPAAPQYQAPPAQQHPAPSGRQQASRLPALAISVAVAASIAVIALIVVLLVG
ncbi:serine/threonine-protein kinase [Tsukamurella soli]|uniref:non-specific serine/threonine protein kinase n=1 Tax=Tsukamurella soli TaxID=644556 RepID=A0ABP8J4D0_9ACTN